MTQRPLLAAAVLAALFATSPAHANDSTAELSTGGLVLKRHAGIAMKSEDLFISEHEVRVDYRFLNTTPKDLRVLVAFPMPDIAVEGIDDMLAIPTEDPQNILDFHTRIDGQPVKAQIEQKAVDAKGVDRTALLKSLGVPIAPHLQAVRAALDHLPPASRAKLRALDMTVDDDFDAGKGQEHHLAPHWTLKTTYYWEQVFPARRELRVEHRYKPSVGGTSGTGLESPEYRASKDFRTYQADYCIEPSFLAAVDAAKRRAGPNAQAYFEKRIAYVLKSGANWKAPIGEFHLTIDKGRPDNLVSFCAQGVKKTSPTRFEVRRKDFLPTRNLKILILQPVEAQ